MDYLEFEEANSPIKASAKKDVSSRGMQPGIEQKPFSLELQGNPREPGYILDPIRAAQEAQVPNSIFNKEMKKRIDDSNKMHSQKQNLVMEEQKQMDPPDTYFGSQYSSDSDMPLPPLPGSAGPKLNMPIDVRGLGISSLAANDDGKTPE